MGHRGVLLDVDSQEDLEQGPDVKKVLIKGAGEHSSGTAHRLFRCGFDVVMTEIAQPTAVRRAVSFCTAAIDGECVVEGVRGVRCETLGEHAGFIPVLIDPDCRVRESWRPDIVIDGRILKRNLDNSMDDAPLVIGFGPGLVAGRDVHVVVETMRGHNLGRIITDGPAMANTGIPGASKGFTYQRVLRAPADGAFETRFDIGDMVEAGQVLGTVAGREVVAAIAGVIRGLIYPGTVVWEGLKIGDIDPRGDVGYCTALSDKTRTLSGAVVEIILSWDAWSWTAHLRNA